MMNVDFNYNNIMARDKFVIFMYLFFVFVLRYFLVPEHSSLYNIFYLSWSIFIFITVLFQDLFKNKSRLDSNNTNLTQYYRSIYWLFFLSMMLITLIVFNFTVKGFSIVGWNNLRKVLEVFIPSTYFIHISRNYEFKEMYEFLKYISRILNIYFLINIPIIFMEYYTGSFMVSRFLGVNSYLSDQVTGLIGLNGTAIMSLYWSALLFVNYAIYSVTKRRIRLILMISEFILMFFISQYMSEIKNFIPTLIVLMATLVLIQINKRLSLKFVRNIFIVVIATMLIFWGLYSLSEIYRVVINNFKQVYLEFISGSDQGSDIRIHTFWISLNELRNIGFSNIDFSSQNYVSQLDVTSLNTLIIFGGMGLTSIIFAFTSQVLSIITNRRVVGNYFWSNLGYIIFIIYISIITVPYQEPRLFLFVYILAMEFHFVVYLKQNENINGYSMNQSRILIH